MSTNNKLDGTQPLVSVIIPIYNASKYLRQCLDSILNQTLKEIEVICVDDGSKDDSYQILQTYEKEDSRIIILQQPNKGAGAARNYGLSIARGKYLSFFDSDDFFHQNLLESSVKTAEKYNSDIVIYKSIAYYENKKRFTKSLYFADSPYIPKKEVFSYRDCPKHIFECCGDIPWNKLFSHEFVKTHNLQFQEIHTHNDVYFSLSAVCLAERITILDNVYVYHRKGIYTNLQSNKFKSPNDIYSALSKVYDKVSTLDIWKSLENGFVNRALMECISRLDQIILINPDSAIDFLDVLMCGGFESIGCSNIKVSQIADKYYYRQYQKCQAYTSQKCDITSFLAKYRPSIISRGYRFIINMVKYQFIQIKRFGLLYIMKNNLNIVHDIVFIDKNYIHALSH